MPDCLVLVGVHELSETGWVGGLGARQPAVTFTVYTLTSLPVQPLLPESLRLTLAQPLGVLLLLLLLVPPGQLLHLQRDSPGADSVPVQMQSSASSPHLDPSHSHLPDLPWSTGLAMTSHLCSLVLKPDLDHTHTESRLCCQCLSDLTRREGDKSGLCRWQLKGGSWVEGWEEHSCPLPR